MIKKVIACLTICFIITGIMSPVFSDASALPQPNWSDPGISEIINISDLTGWMLNGGTFDVSTYTDAESFMNDYFNARTKTRLVSPGEAQEDYYEVLPGFGINNQLVAGESFARPLETNRVIASSFRDHTGYGRRLSNEVNEALLSSGNLYDTKIPLLNEVEFANFVGYNHDALRLYSEFFITESDYPTPNPPSDYSFITYCGTYLIGSSNLRVDLINTLWKVGDYEITKNLPFSMVSFNGDNFAADLTLHQLNDIAFLTAGTIYCTSNNNGYTVQYDGFEFLNFYPLTLRNNNYSFAPNLQYNVNAQRFNSNNLTTGYINKSTFRTSFDSLSVMMNYFYNSFRGCNIYVDDVPYSIVGSEPTNIITPEFPDAVGGEELENTTWPISRPRAPYYTNVPGVLQAIEDAIADDGKLDIDDLKPYLTDENGDPVPDPIFDPEPVPIPVPDPINPDIIPGLPVLPAIPPEMPGFNGVSVLAEIINFTNQSLPTSLIVTFWGIVFGIVILGLIKILHK